MKKIIIPIVLSFAFIFETSAQQEKLALKNLADSVAYAFGISVSKQLNNTIDQAGKENFNVEMFKKGIDQGLMKKEKPLLNEQQIRMVMNRFQQQMAAAMQQKRAAEGAKNLEAGKAFLAENAAKEGVQVTPSGLQYKVIRPGTGDTPAATDKVEVHYEGKLINGEVFDSSYKRGKPTQFGLNQVISGWTEGLQLMQPGSKYQFFIPSNLGYGERGQGQQIGPNSVLIFEVELIRIVK